MWLPFFLSFLLTFLEHNFMGGGGGSLGREKFVKIDEIDLDFPNTREIFQKIKKNQKKFRISNVK